MSICLEIRHGTFKRNFSWSLKESRINLNQCRRRKRGALRKFAQSRSQLDMIPQTEYTEVKSNTCGDVERETPHDWQEGYATFALYLRIECLAASFIPAIRISYRRQLFFSYNSLTVTP